MVEPKVSQPIADSIFPNPDFPDPKYGVKPKSLRPRTHEGPDIHEPVVFSPWEPTFMEAPPALVATDEQWLYIDYILKICCSDSQFAKKAHDAILFILAGGVPAEIPGEAPTITSLTPDTAVLGSPNFTLHVNGTGFTSTSQIVWNGGVEPTTYVSATELTTEVNMSTATTAAPVPVLVRTAGVDSAPMTFTLTGPAVLSASANPTAKK